MTRHDGRGPRLAAGPDRLLIVEQGHVEIEQLQFGGADDRQAHVIAGGSG